MRRRTIVAIVAGAVVVLAVAGVALWLATRPPSAEDGAMRYLDALAAGDLATIVDMRGTAAYDDDQEVVAAAFASAMEYPSKPRIEQLSPARDLPTSVRASVELAGERRTIFFVMEQADGRWKLTGDYLGAVTVTTSLGDSVWVGDALAPVVDSIPLLPAVYSIEAAPRGILTGEATVVVTNETPLDIELQASISPEAVTVAQQQLDAYQDACTASAPAVPPDCGLRVPWAADLASLTSIAWRIDQRPALTLAPDGRTFAATGGIVVATATGTTAAGTTSSFTYRADDWALRGSVTFSEDAMTLAVD